MRAIADWLHRRAENVAAAMLAVMFGAFVVQIAFRYLLDWPLGWTSELTVVLWLWLVLWGSAFVVREREAIRFDWLYSFYLVFTIAVIVRYLRILARLLRGGDPEEADPSVSGSGL